MNIFRNKRIWQKIVIILLVILLFKFVINIPIVHAGSDDGVLLEPITNLFANLGDGIMEIAQKTFLNMDSSGAWIEKEDNTWLKILTIVVGVLIAIVAIVASIVSGGGALVIITSALGAVLKIFAGTAIAYFAVTTLNIGESGFYLPEYELTLGAILKNEVLAFDVNFFNPKKPELTYSTTVLDLDVGQDNNRIEKFFIQDDLNSTRYQEDVSIITHQDQWEMFKEKYGAEGVFSDYTATHKNSNAHSGDLKLMDTGTPEGIPLHKYEWTNKKNGKKYSVYYAYQRSQVNGQGPEWDFYYLYNFTSPGYSYEEYNYSPAHILQPTIASWYLVLRNIAIVALLSILVYIGIRITLTSVAGDKAKYKQMLVDWIVAIALVFLMHYIMSFAVSINELIIKGIDGITLATYGTQEDIVGKNPNEPVTTQDAAYKNQKMEEDYNNKNGVDNQGINAAGVECFIIDNTEAVKAAYKVLVEDGSQPEGGGANSPFYNRFQFDSNNDPAVLYWPANDFTVQARILGQDLGIDANQTKVARAGYNIIYVVLVIYTIMFCFTYLRRVIYMAFLTLVAPLVAITYPIDKLNDGKAQAFDMWLKEYIFNLLMQPMHLILYTILIGMALKFASHNIFYAVVAIGFLVPAEKILRRFFRFERAQTPGMFQGAAGAALMMQGLNKLMHRPQNRSRLGAGSNSKDDEENSKVTKFRGKDPLGAGRGQTNDNNDDNANDDSQVRTTGENSDQQESGDSPQNPQVVNDGSQNAGSGSNANINVSNNHNNNGIIENENLQGHKKRKIHPLRMVRRGLITRGEGMKKRYKANKKIKGGLIRRAARLSAGVAAAGTMAAAGGIIGIATGDMSKAAKFMGAGAVGGYKLGEAGVNKTAKKVEEQYEEPLKQAKIGFYGEEEYQKREHEKWKKQEFERNKRNILRVQEHYNCSWEEAKERTKKMGDFTNYKGINDFDKAFAVYKTSTEGGGNSSTQEALIEGSLVNGDKLNGKGADSLSRDARMQFMQDLADKIRSKNRNISREEAMNQAARLVAGTNDYAKNLK